MTAALVALLAVQAGPPAPAIERRETITVRWDAFAKTCVPTVRGVETGDLSAEAGRRALGDAVPDKGGTIALIGGAGVPYPCAIGVVDVLRRAGFYGRIVSPVEPPR